MSCEDKLLLTLVILESWSLVNLPEIFIPYVGNAVIKCLGFSHESTAREEKIMEWEKAVALFMC